MAVAPIQLSRTVLRISLYVEVVGGTACSFLTFLLCIMEMTSVFALGDPRPFSQKSDCWYRMSEARPLVRVSALCSCDNHLITSWWHKLCTVITGYLLTAILRFWSLGGFNLPCADGAVKNLLTHYIKSLQMEGQGHVTHCKFLVPHDISGKAKAKIVKICTHIV